MIALDSYPTSVKIGAVTYSIEVGKIDDPKGGETPYGGHDCTTAKIHLCSDGVARSQIGLTLLHEIFHGIYADRGLHRGNGEERVVDQMSAGVAAVMRDNPEVMSWIVRMIDG